MPPYSTYDQSSGELRSSLCSNSSSTSHSSNTDDDSQRKVQKRRENGVIVSLSWDATETIYDVPSVHDMELDEIESYWYNASEFTIIKAQIDSIAKRMRTRKSPENDCCYRGLEYKSKVIGKRRKMRKARVAKAVLDEQQRQRYENISDPDLLAEIVKGYTNLCTTDAIRIATQDAEIANKIYNTKHETAQTEDDSNNNTNGSDDMDSISVLSDSSSIDSQQMNLEKIPICGRTKDLQEMKRRISV